MSYTVNYLESEMAAQNFEIIVLVNCLVQDATRLGASDLHIEPWENSIASAPESMECSLKLHTCRSI